MLKTEAEKHRHEREKLKRKSAAGRSDHDIVACFSHNRLIDVTKASFQEHRSIDGRRGEPVYTIKTDICENVVEIGKEVSSIDGGYDYAVAIVDREAGTTTYRPVRLYNFQATYSSDIPQLIGEKRSAPIDYSASYDIKTEEWAKKRMDLTADFGSSKKMKIQEASIRRQINTETLDAMRKTAFASTSVLADTEDIKQDQISLVVKAESAILPHAQPAELPRNIYPISTFITEEEQELLSSSAVEFLSSSKKELLEKGSQWDRGPNGRTAARLAVSTDEKDKLIAHLLALGLTLSQFCSNNLVQIIFVGLGCTIVQCTVEEAARTESLRAARLLRPPSKDGPTVRRRRK
ncbi:A49-like RNA polymerase I associated factor [Teladorsagia circumcincta]|uniref:A49-like RNA polymerase I associated factor n=1 Tax=Teladorsagia circumcincta TaxID=45464 RepID=A0A2G9U113_TELCI|nr:A49-like RNA polymerase I associated factor [Teladorsagia circumcincta]